MGKHAYRDGQGLAILRLVDERHSENLLQWAARPAAIESASHCTMELFRLGLTQSDCTTVNQLAIVVLKS